MNTIVKLTKKVTTKVSNIVRTEKVRFVNHDGTIAESPETYREFRQDVISSFGRC